MYNNSRKQQALSSEFSTLHSTTIHYRMSNETSSSTSPLKSIYYALLQSSKCICCIYQPIAMIKLGFSDLVCIVVLFSSISIPTIAGTRSRGKFLNDLSWSSLQFPLQDYPLQWGKARVNMKGSFYDKEQRKSTTICKHKGL